MKMKWYQCSECSDYFQDTVKLHHSLCKSCRTLPCVELPPGELIMVLLGGGVFIGAIALFLQYVSSL